MTTAALRARLVDLMVDEVTEGLTASDMDEMHRLEKQFPDLKHEEFEACATAVHLAFAGGFEEMPADLQRSVRAAGKAFAADRATGDVASVISLDEHQSRVAKQEPTSLASAFGWIAAAAILSAAVLGWIPGLNGPLPAPSAPRVAQRPTPPTPAEAMTKLSSAPGSLTLPWTATEDPAAADAGGEVVWSDAEQVGFMRFTGLPTNDPVEYQYQLWIFDPTQDERYPIDGGVFDVAGPEAVVPIDPKLRVDGPTLFAVTIEKPGGVVVSSRERLVLIAPVA